MLICMDEENAWALMHKLTSAQNAYVGMYLQEILELILKSLR